MDTVEKQLKLLQKIIDRCVEHDYKRVEGLYFLKANYLDEKQQKDYIRKEIFILVENLASLNQQYPSLKEFAFSWHIPDFIWETSFFEVIIPDEKTKFINFSYEDFDDKIYSKQPTAYDEALPNFSNIIKMVVFSRYLKKLQELENSLLLPQVIKKASIKSLENTSVEKIVGKDNLFSCNLNDHQIHLLAECVNKAHIFTTEITPQILEDFFYCRLSGALKSKNNRLLVYFMVELNIRRYITNEWQSVIANNNLILAPMKEKHLNASDLSTACDKIRDISPKNSEIIDKYIEQLKKG